MVYKGLTETYEEAAKKREKCKHNWIPVSFIREPIKEGKVYCVCMKCKSHTYAETRWIGFKLNHLDEI